MPLKSKLKPPSELKLACEKQIWKTIVGAYSGDFFNEGDIPLLVNYVRLKTTADRLYGEYSKTGEIVKVKGIEMISTHYKLYMSTVNSLAGLAQKLRIAPSARMRQEAPGSSAKRSSSNRDFNPAGDWRKHQNT